MLLIRVINKILESCMFTFVSKKFFSQLLGISPKNFFLKMFDLECSGIDIWFTDQNSKPLEIEDLLLNCKI